MEKLIFICSIQSQYKMYKKLDLLCKNIKYSIWNESKKIQHWIFFSHILPKSSIQTTRNSNQRNSVLT